MAGVLNPAMALMPCHCLLLEAGADLVLVDAGIGLADMAEPRRLGPMSLVLNLKQEPEETAVRQVERMGFAPGDVKHILCTHLDLDHAGGLADFPQARVHVMEAEHEACAHPGTAREKKRYRPCHFQHGPDWVTHQELSPEKWFGLDCIRDLPGLPPEIVLIPLPGHTRGHMGVAVKTGDAWLLHCGDAYDLRDEMLEGRRSPLTIRLFQHVAHMDHPGAMDRKEALKAVVRESGGTVTLMATHEPAEYEELSGKRLFG